MKSELKTVRVSGRSHVSRGRRRVAVHCGTCGSERERPRYLLYIIELHISLSQLFFLDSWILTFTQQCILVLVVLSANGPHL